MKMLRGVPLLVFLLLFGCSGGGGDVAGTTGPGAAQQPVGPGPGAATTGDLVVEVPLVNSRAVKSDVRTFRLTLSRNGQIVVARDFARSDALPEQQLLIAGLAPGDYQLEILYLGSAGAVLGTFNRQVTIVAGQTTTVGDPAYQNTVPDFETLRLLPTSGFPYSFAFADFNEDGHPDIVVTDTFSTSVSTSGRIFVALGNADGTYQPAFPVEVGVSSYWVAIGDFNKDSHADVVTSNQQDVSVLLGNGDGSFQAAVPLSLDGGQDAVAIKAVDLNQDGNLDLVTANFTSENASVFLGNGNGTFAAAVNHALGSGPLDIVPVDLDGDNVLDLVGSNSGGTTLSVLLGQGDGSFAPGADLTIGDGPSLLATADFNQDGFPDFAAATFGSDTVSVLLSNGANGFSPPQSYGVGDDPVSVVVGDANGDGHQDLLVANFVSNDLSLLLGQGGGVFTDELRLEGYVGPNYAVFADLNGDGRQDIVSVQFPTGAVLFTLQRADGTFLEGGRRVPVGTQPRPVRTADLDGDGFLDLASANFSSSDVSVARGRGDGTFAPSQSIPVPNSPVDLLVGDFTEDGLPDLVVAGTGVVLLEGNVSTPVLGGTVEQVGSGDFNADGHLDLALVTGSTQVTVLLGRGDGSFEPPVSTDAGVACNRLTVSDFDGDGNLDVATLNLGARVAVLLGNGDGTFAPLPSFHVPDPAGASIVIFVTSGDLNLDGQADLLVTNTVAGSLSLLWGKGDGTFGPRDLVEVGRGVVEVLIADVNGDGVPDLTGTFANLTVAKVVGVGVLTGEGDGTFRAPLYFMTSSAFSLAAGDFNLDGALDLAVSEIFAHALTVLLAR